MKPTESNYKKLRSFLGKTVIVKAKDASTRSYGYPKSVIHHHGVLISVSWTKDSDGYQDGYIMLDHSRDMMMADVLDIWPASELGKVLYGE